MTDTSPEKKAGKKAGRKPEDKEASRYVFALARAIAGIPVPDWKKMPTEERRKFVTAARRVVNVQKKWATRGVTE